MRIVLVVSAEPAGLGVCVARDGEPARAATSVQTGRDNTY